MTFGNVLKEARRAQGWTLRKFCLTHKLDPGNISRVERGVFGPPRDPLVILGWLRMMGYVEPCETIRRVLRAACETAVENIRQSYAEAVKRAEEPVGKRRA